MNNKFDGIKYPIYCLKRLPELEVSYEKLVTDSGKLVKHRHYTAPTYLETLIKMDQNKENRITFDATARNIGELIRSKVQWGIDNSGKIFDLSQKQKFPFKLRKIHKIAGNLVWVKDISYPLELYADLEDIKYDLYLYFIHLVKVNLTWEIYNFSLSLPKREKTWIYL